MSRTWTTFVMLVLLLGAACTSEHPARSPRVRDVPTARQLFVAPSGSDNNPGTGESPFRQVAAAARAATPGTIVHVAPGSYGPVVSQTSGTPAAPVVFKSDRRWGARISGAGRRHAWTNTGQWVVIDGFDITGAQYEGITTTGSNGTIRDNHIHHLVPPDCSRGGGGIVAESYTARNNDAIDNVVNDIAVRGPCALIHGIYYQSPHAGRILGNRIYRVAGSGIHLWHNANSITISGNTVSHNGQDGILVGGSLEGNDRPPGIASGVTVTGNVAVGNRLYGISEGGRVGRNTYADNTFSGNGRGDYHLLSPP